MEAARVIKFEITEIRSGNRDQIIVKVRLTGFGANASSAKMKVGDVWFTLPLDECSSHFNFNPTTECLREAYKQIQFRAKGESITAEGRRLVEADAREKFPEADAIP